MSPEHPPYVLDTNVLSELSRKEPNSGVIAWLKSERAAMIIPSAAVIEIERGIVHLACHNAHRAALLSKWLDALQTSDVIHGVMNLETARLYGRMTTVPALYDLWISSPIAKKPTLGQDLSIAALAIVMGAPVATINIKDFMKIDRFFPLPGLYNPANDKWLIRPRVTTKSHNSGNSQPAGSHSKRPAPPLSHFAIYGNESDP